MINHVVYYLYILRELIVYKNKHLFIYYYDIKIVYQILYIIQFENNK